MDHSSATSPGRKVLVADDDPIFRSVASELVCSWGYECVAVADGEAALHALEQDQAPTIAVLDWQMPGFTGPEICRRIRMSGSPRYTYFILVSARDGRADSIEGLRSGADNYISKPLDAQELRAKLEIAERILFMEGSLRDLHAETELFINSVPSILIGTDAEGKITRWNQDAEKTFGLTKDEVKGRGLATCGIPWVSPEVGLRVAGVTLTGVTASINDLAFRKDGDQRLLGLTIHPLRSHLGSVIGTVIIAADVTEKRSREEQLRQAQKLEAIGQLAAGIAHEINTPIQFVSDNVNFLKESWLGFSEFITRARALRSQAAVGSTNPDVLAAFDDHVQRLDLDYLLKEIPQAIDESLQGLQRVTKIVRAMKEFSHPDSEMKQHTDINQAIATTITVARNVWKYVADLDTDFDPELPAVPCIVGHFNQVILNMIVNAAQAIADVVGDREQGKGRITIRTRHDADAAVITIEDTGKGIPQEIRGRVFEPFFTTKPVGKGTGQGLALAHSIIVKEHKGSIWFESETGRGTVFYVRLPLAPSEGEQALPSV